MNKTVFSSISYTYDENGHIGYRTSMTDASGEAHWTYDLRGRMIEEAKTIVDRGTYITQWRYDSQNRVTQMFYPNGDRISYDYNHQGEIVQLNSYYQTILQSRVFDQNGRVIEQKFGNGSTTHYEYETWTGAAGAIKKIQSGLSLNSNDVSLQNLSYAYDLVGNITRIDDDGEILNFTYDALNRLKSVSGAYAESYDYDPNTGNLMRKAGSGDYCYSSGKPHAVTGYEGKDHLFEYDANGQMIKRHGQNIRYDAQGNLVSYLGKTYFYDGDGKRVAMVHPDGKTTIYIGNYYETVWIPIDDIGPVTPPVFMNSEQNNYSYFPFVGNGEGPNFETVPGKSYYYAGSSRIAMKTENYETIWIYGDHLGSTSVTADRDGEELSRTKYHAWGTMRYSSGVQATDYGYTGQMQVDDIYYYNARWYDPAIGRFLQADTIVPPHQGTQGFDRYAYVNNNPMRYTDPSGNYTCGDIYDPGCFENDYEQALFDQMRAPKPIRTVTPTPTPIPIRKMRSLLSFAEIMNDPVELLTRAALSEAWGKLGTEREIDIIGIIWTMKNRAEYWNAYDYRGYTRAAFNVSFNDQSRYLYATTDGVDGMLYRKDDGAFIYSYWMKIEWAANAYFDGNVEEVQNIYNQMYSLVVSALDMANDPTNGANSYYDLPEEGASGKTIFFDWKDLSRGKWTLP